MPDRSDVMYLYDGSLEGLLCCVFESFRRRELPFCVQSADAPQLSLCPVRAIETDLSHAARVRRGLRRTASDGAWELFELGYYTCHPQRELLALDFVHLAMRHGPAVLSMLADDTVAALTKATRQLCHEAHQYQGFVRFSDSGGVLTAVIEPKNFVLPLLAPHFCDRYQNDTFAIYDKTHGMLLAYARGQHAILPVEGFDAPAADEEELRWRALWKSFYNAIAIDERYNPTCRPSLMQKRYWRHLTELDPQVPTRRASIEERLRAGERVAVPDRLRGYSPEQLRQALAGDPLRALYEPKGEKDEPQ